MIDQVEFAARVELLLAEWQLFYDRNGIKSASPLMDRIMAERLVSHEMLAEENDVG
jgi:hypothetical protein